MADAFDYTVRSALDDADVSAWKADALMVGAVDQEAFPVDLCKQRTLYCMGKMKLVTLFIAVFFRLGQMLTEPASKKEIDQLHSFADSEDRAAKLHEPFQQDKLFLIQSRVNIAAGGMFFLGKRGQRFVVGQKGRIDVAAAGQDQAVPAAGGMRV